MLRFADLVEEHLLEIAELDSVNAGKPITDCETLDFPDVVATLRWYAESVDEVFGKVALRGTDALALILAAAILGFVQSARDEGATILHGGQRELEDTPRTVTTG